MVIVKSEEELSVMRKAGRIVRDVLDLVGENAKEGVSTKQLDKIAYEYITKCGATPSFLHYNGFTGSLCTSIDCEVVHGIPSSKRILEEGQLLKLDAGAAYHGMHGDAARTYLIGKVSEDKKRLAEVCKQSFFEGINILRSGVRLGDLGWAIQSYVESNGFSVVREMVGHGIGYHLHEEPNVPNYGIPGRGLRLYAGMTIAVEPMINLGVKEIETLSDGWTTVTLDRKASAHYENTVIITDDGVEIITL